jgi:hypothetical protein
MLFISLHVNSYSDMNGRNTLCVKYTGECCNLSNIGGKSRVKMSFQKSEGPITDCAVHSSF